MSQRISLVHLSGPRRGESDELRLPAVIGSLPGLDVTIPGIAPRHALVRWETPRLCRGGSWSLTDPGLAVSAHTQPCWEGRRA
jgi:hypothetical protein